jgi:NitT/TauT family transport system permease protein
MFRLSQVAFLIALFVLWHILVQIEVLPKFFFGEPLKVLEVTADLFLSGKIFPHLLVTLIETLLAFFVGTSLGLGAGLWLGLNKTAAAFLNPFLTALNAMPRVILAPIFTVWFGLTIASKVALGVTLVVFIVFFSVFNGVRDANPNILNSTRMLGASRTQLIRYFYLPSAMSWVFSSLHASIGMAFVGAVVGEYLGSAKGVGYLILQAESVFDINTVFAGIIILTIFALLLDAAVTFIENKVLVWRPV